MPAEDTIKVQLHEIMVNVVGDPFKDTLKETRSRGELIKLSPQEIDAGLPDMTLGNALSQIIGGKGDCKDVAESAKFYRIHAKIHNKTITGKGEWNAHLAELEDVKECLEAIKPIAPTQQHGGMTLSPAMHGQVFAKIEDYILKSKMPAS